MKTELSGWRELAGDIAEQIRSGRLAPGDRLSTEEAMRETTGLSRTTIRMAIVELCRLGLVENRGKSGTFVLGPGGPFTLRLGESLTSSAALIVTDPDGSTRTLPVGTRIVVGAPQSCA